MRRSTVALSPGTSPLPAWAVWCHHITTVPITHISQNHWRPTRSWEPSTPQWTPTRASTWRRTMYRWVSGDFQISPSLREFFTILILLLRLLSVTAEGADPGVRYAAVQIQTWAEAAGEDSWKCRSHRCPCGWVISRTPYPLFPSPFHASSAVLMLTVMSWTSSRQRWFPGAAHHGVRAAAGGGGAGVRPRGPRAGQVPLRSAGTSHHQHGLPPDRTLHLHSHVWQGEWGVETEGWHFNTCCKLRFRT